MKHLNHHSSLLEALISNLNHQPKSMNRSHFNEQHLLDKEWLSKLSFYKDELSVLRNRLTEVAQKYTDKEIKMQVSHFENQLIIQAEKLDEIKHEINVLETTIEQSVLQNPTAADRRSFPEQDQLADSVNTYEKLFLELRQEMNKFFAKNM